MMDPALPVQAALFAALKAHAGLAAAFGGPPRIYDYVPVDGARQVTAAFPFVHLGEDQVVSDADQCHDASTLYTTVHVWSRRPGKVEAKTIMAQVCLAADAILPVAGFQMIAHAVDDGPRYLTDGDGLSTHAVATFRYRLGPV